MLLMVCELLANADEMFLHIEAWNKAVTPQYPAHNDVTARKAANPSVALGIEHWDASVLRRNLYFERRVSDRNIGLAITCLHATVDTPVTIHYAVFNVQLHRAVPFPKADLCRRYEL